MQLSDEHLAVIRSILLRHFGPRKIKVYLFGSRISEEATRASDLDILLENSEPISLGKLGMLKDTFETSDLPFKVDLLDAHRTDETMKRNILRSAEPLSLGTDPHGDGS